MDSTGYGAFVNFLVAQKETKQLLKKPSVKFLIALGKRHI